MKIQVCDLSKFVTDEILANAFGKFGAVASATVVKDKVTGLSKRFGFVEMPDRAEALAAIKNLNHTQILKVPIRVKQAGTQKFTGTFTEPASSTSSVDRSAGRPQPAQGPWKIREKEPVSKTTYESKPAAPPLEHQYIRREKTPVNKSPFARGAVPIPKRENDFRPGFRKQHGPDRNDKARAHFSPRNDDRFSDVPRNANSYDRGPKSERAYGQTGARQRSKSPFGVFKRQDNSGFSETPRSDYKGKRERPFGKTSAFNMDRSFGHARPMTTGSRKTQQSETSFSPNYGDRQARRDFPKLNDSRPSHGGRTFQGVRPFKTGGKPFGNAKPSFEGRPSFRSRPSSHSRKKSGW